MYEAVIGLEIHVELLTNSKMFCACKNAFSTIPNTHVCPICLSLPGTLPTVNHEAVMKGIETALLLNAHICPHSTFDRKQYQYPDLPKGYQITQFNHPYAKGGYVDLQSGARIYLDHIHLEEDAGKTLHEDKKTKIDYNRCGVPLMEIVTTPCIKSAQQAKEFLTLLKDLLVHQGITDGKMQEGSMRCDVNVSLKKSLVRTLGERVELKNISGLRATQHAIEYEISRQQDMLNKGEIIKRETRRWNELTKTSQLMRKKEDLLDYRYFEEPDLPPLHITNAMIEQAKKRLKPTKAQHLATLVHEYGMTQKEADFLFANADILAYFKLVYPDFSDTTALLSWLMGDWLSFAKAKMQADTQFSLAKLLPKKDDFIYLLTAIKSQTISRKNAKSALEHIILTNQSAKEYIASNNLHQSTHVDEEIAHFAKLCLEQNAPLVNEYIQGKTKVFAFFMGQLIKRYPSTSPKVLKEALLSAFKQYSA